MTERTIRIRSITELHEMLGFAKPKHPQITVFDAAKIHVTEEGVGLKIIYDFYMISMKDKSCGVEYGRQNFDFGEGVMVFSAPGQVYSPTKIIHEGDITGWMLFFHPDLIHGTHLASQMDSYSFFNYEVREALHLSEDEEAAVAGCLENIRKEYGQRIDNHSQRVIVSNLELLLNYCWRYYERQFNTRAHKSIDTVHQFEKDLKDYFNNEQQLEAGLPSIQYFAEKVNLSKHYFSDLLKKATGRTAKDHINEFVIEKAKDLLLSTNDPISQVAYHLGFNYPHYFTRLFKTKTGRTPAEYRSLN